MTCDELRSDYLLFAMGTMEEPEAGEIRAHLQRSCETCIAGVREARVLACSMGVTVDGPEPPRRLRRQVLAIGGRVPERTPSWPVLGLAAACVTVALAPAFVWHRESAHWKAMQLETTSKLRQEESVAASLRGQVARLESPPPRAVPIFSLELVRGADSGEPGKQLDIPKGTSDVVLALPTDLMRQASSVELRNSSGQTVWTVARLRASSSEAAGLTIAAKLLEPGGYLVLLRVGEHTIARLPFRVTVGK